MIIEFHLNNKCNLRCTYCYQHYKSHDSMSLETGKQIIDTLFPTINKDTYKNYFKDIDSFSDDPDNPLEFSFFGGEALLDVDLIDEIMTHFVKVTNGEFKNYIISIGTNGILLSTKKVEAFSEKWLDHIRYDVTVDGNKEFHDTCRKFENGEGSFDIAYENFIKYNKLYGNAHVPLTAKLTVSPENIAYFADAYKFLDNLEVFINFNFACGKQSEWSDENINICKSQLRLVSDYILEKYGHTQNSILVFDNTKLGTDCTISSCGTEGDRISIDWNGDIFTCQMFSSTSIHDGSYKPLGNVFDGIDANQLKLNEFSITQREMIYPKSCDGCRAKRMLCEQCPAESYELFGDVSIADTSRCKPTKILLAEIDRYHRLKNKK